MTIDYKIRLDEKGHEVMIPIKVGTPVQNQKPTVEPKSVNPKLTEILNDYHKHDGMRIAYL